MQNRDINFVFFGSSPISIASLDSLEKRELLPSLIITKPDSPQGRGLITTPSPVKIWAEKRKIECLTPEKLKGESIISRLKDLNPKLGVLVSYGKIIPREILEIFEKGILNLHPSLLPKLRGPSPIEGTILNDMKESVGITVMLLDEKMDTGPIITQKKIAPKDWPPKKTELYELLSKEGGDLLADTLPKWIKEEIKANEQNNLEATYCKMIEKKDGEINLNEDPYKNFLKIRAFDGWPGTFFFIEKENKKIRVKITGADYTEQQLIIKKVIPEGKKEMTFEDFKKGIGF